MVRPTTPPTPTAGGAPAPSLKRAARSSPYSSSGAPAAPLATKRARSASLTLTTPAADHAAGGGVGDAPPPAGADDPPSRPPSLSPPSRPPSLSPSPGAEAVPGGVAGSGQRGAPACGGRPPLPSFPPSRRTLARRRAAAAAVASATEAAAAATAAAAAAPPPLTWPGLVYAWSAALGATQPTTPLLACHLWRRARGGLAASSATPTPGGFAALAACLWVAAKHEEARAAVPAASAVAGLARADAASLRAAELAVLAAVDWRPLDGWVVGRGGGGTAVAVAS